MNFFLDTWNFMILQAVITKTQARSSRPGEKLDTALFVSTKALKNGSVMPVERERTP